MHKVTHRRIAGRAQVPLGSLTYYFSGLEDILEAAFSWYVETMAGTYQELLQAAGTAEETVEALVQFIHRAARDPERMRVLFELYSYAQYNEAASEIVRGWMTTTERHLLDRFPPGAATAIDAFVEGLLVRQAMQNDEIPEAVVRSSLRALAGPSAGVHS
ncbi:TetR/AcrR family transcriptional regulator [Nocardiopsis salina]|uniref:TetR/AcrR family transcriptional regulator n=1 Tax=Nocardiopsis salina TaxID=245836 RepID=UPI0003746E8F|nr:TetR family transcriptional regulator C-terminal domain-containing protein [Nocardiopsis salina]